MNFLLLGYTPCKVPFFFGGCFSHCVNNFLIWKNKIKISNWRFCNFPVKIWIKLVCFFKPQKIGKRKQEIPWILDIFFKKGKKKSRIYISGVIHACFVAFFGYLLFLNPLFSSCLFFVGGGGGVGCGGRALFSFLPSRAQQFGVAIVGLRACVLRTATDARLSSCNARSLAHEREGEKQRNNRDFWERNLRTSSSSIGLDVNCEDEESWWRRIVGELVLGFYLLVWGSFFRNFFL
jgi:hypothetical protein